MKNNIKFDKVPRLHHAEFVNCDFSNLDFYQKRFERTRFVRCDFTKSCFSEATFSNANFHECDFSYADFDMLRGRGGWLTNCNFFGVRRHDTLALFNVKIREPKNMSPLLAAQLMTCPAVGDFIGWKKCRNGVVVKLLIPADADRSSAVGRKCRASHVRVLEVIGAEEGVSMYDGGATVYRVGETVYSRYPFEIDRWKECASGIHFFVTREEAENYVY